jgi:hypothetical protein
MRSMNSMSPSLKPAPGFFSATALATKRSVTQASTRREARALRASTSVGKFFNLLDGGDFLDVFQVAGAGLCTATTLPARSLAFLMAGSMAMIMPPEQ